MQEQELIEFLSHLHSEASQGPWRPCRLQPTGSPATVEQMRSACESMIVKTDELYPANEFHFVSVKNDKQDKDIYPDVTVAITANGPTSEANARFIANIQAAWPYVVEYINSLYTQSEFREAVAKAAESSLYGNVHGFALAYLNDPTPANWAPLAEALGMEEVQG